jgi:hypothetical protein
MHRGFSFLSIVRRKDPSESAIAQHIEQRGGRVVRIRRTPFAELWFGQTSEPIFDVTYRDPAGVERQTTCKVSAAGALSWLDAARDPRIPREEQPLTTVTNGARTNLTCPFCRTPVHRGAKRCKVCRVPFVGT